MNTEKDFQLANQTNVELREEIIRLENEKTTFKRMLGLYFDPLLAIVKKEDIANHKLIDNLLFELDKNGFNHP